jgi:hypothetical protein
VQSTNVSFGQFAARSSAITHAQTSSLSLSRVTPAGVGSFDLMVSSEEGWDRLEFYLNGALKERWSGNVGWRSYLFALSAGTNTMEWRYTKDFSISIGLDAAFIDNLELPSRPTLIQLLSFSSAGPRLQLQGQSNHLYVIQASSDLTNWQPIFTNIAVNGVIQISDPQAQIYPVRFYRAARPLTP